MTRRWAIEVLWFAVVVAGGWLFGFLVGAPIEGVLLALFAYAAWHLTQLFRLSRYLSSDKTGAISAPGIWGIAFNAISDLQESDRRRKKKLDAMRRRFEQSSASLPDAVVIINGKSEILWFNQAAIRFLGLSWPRDAGCKITDRIATPEFAEYLSAENYELPLEVASPRGNGVQLSLRIVPYGKKQRLISARDVTRLARLESLRRDFVANVSHELRTPLTVITGYLEALDTDGCGGDKEAAQMVTVMRDQADRMGRIVDDLLTLSRLETTQISTEDEERVSGAALAREVLAEARAMTSERHRLVCEADSELYIRGSAKELHSAFSNLVSNAVRYSPDGGEIRIEWHVDDNGAVFSVRDQGIGIAPEHLRRLTERFYRVNKDRSRSTGGTGLGLAIVKHILQRHDATLHVDSVPGEGSRFYCQFPAHRVEIDA